MHAHYNDKFYGDFVVCAFWHILILNKNISLQNKATYIWTTKKFDRNLPNVLIVNMPEIGRSGIPRMAHSQSSSEHCCQSRICNQIYETSSDGSPAKLDSVNSTQSHTFMIKFWFISRKFLIQNKWDHMKIDTWHVSFKNLTFKALWGIKSDKKAKINQDARKFASSPAICGSWESSLRKILP